MGNIFTRKALSDIMTNEGLTPEQRTEQVMGLYGRALDDGYVSKSAAQTAQDALLGGRGGHGDKGRRLAALRIVGLCAAQEPDEDVLLEVLDLREAAGDLGDLDRPTESALLRVRQMFLDEFHCFLPWKNVLPL